jgi:hypothetical protein
VQSEYEEWFLQDGKSLLQDIVTERANPLVDDTAFHCMADWLNHTIRLFLDLCYHTQVGSYAVAQERTAWLRDAFDFCSHLPTNNNLDNLEYLNHWYFVCGLSADDESLVAWLEQ